MADAVNSALEAVLASMHDNNVGLDAAIETLKHALAQAGAKQVLVPRARLPQNTRQGRKMMQTYFRKRGVEVVFDEA